MAAHNLQIGVQSNVIVFSFVYDGKTHALECGPNEARAIANGFNKAANVLDPKRKLYAIAVEKVVKNDRGEDTWAPGGIEFMHAESAAEARLTYFKARDPKQMTRIVGCGPVIGQESNGLIREKF